MSDGNKQFIGGTLVEDGKIKIRSWDLMILKAQSGFWGDLLNSNILEGELFKDGPVDAENAQRIIDKTELRLRRELASIDAYRKLFKEWGEITVEQLQEIVDDPESEYNKIRRRNGTNE